ncbi:MAG: TIGR04552 family protein [Telluria sp.]
MELRATLETKRKFSLNWGYLSAITTGKSAIDLGELALRNLNDARAFAREYGYDLDQPAARAIVQRVHGEAIAFIAATFLTPEQANLIPPEVAQAEDPVQLLVYASQHGQQAHVLRMWSCAVLKVMHAIFYLDNNLELRHFNTIREQVFATLDDVIQHDGECHFLSDGELCLPLLHFDRKRNKGRNSILLKLLHKASYLAADIYDHLGIRLVFNTRFECLLALETLRRAHLLSVTNIEPERTRNTMLDLDAAKQVFVKYRAMLEHSPCYPVSVLQKMDEELAAIARAQTRADNPHSGAGYSSIQITVRKMIHLDGEDGAALDSGFFFDYEIQLMDKASYEKTLTGPASHDAYKRRQVEAARLRVFGRELSDLLDEKKPLD